MLPVLLCNVPPFSPEKLAVLNNNYFIWKKNPTNSVITPWIDAVVIGLNIAYTEPRVTFHILVSRKNNISDNINFNISLFKKYNFCPFRLFFTSVYFHHFFFFCFTFMAGNFEKSNNISSDGVQYLESLWKTCRRGYVFWLRNEITTIFGI